MVSPRSTSNDALLYAVNGQWTELNALITLCPSIAYDSDSGGMSLLHWMCLHQSIDFETIVKLIQANPSAVLQKNSAGHYPIDLALQAQCEDRILALLQIEDEEMEDVRETRNDSETTRPPSRPILSYKHSDYSTNTGRYSEFMEDKNDRKKATETEGIDRQSNRLSSYSDFSGIPSEEERESQQTDYNLNYMKYSINMPPVPERGPHHLTLDRMSRTLGNGTKLQFGDDTMSQQFVRSQMPLYSIYSDKSVDTRLNTVSDNPNKNINSGNEDHFILRTSSQCFDRGSSQNEDDLISINSEPIGGMGYIRKSHIHSKIQSHLIEDDEDKPGAPQSLVLQLKYNQNFPPRWKQSRRCNVCNYSFSIMRRRHHCRNCGHSVCNQHSTHRLPLPKFDLMQPHRLCDTCYGSHDFIERVPVTQSYSVIREK
uniref:Uncharacterized protein AlNc14C236G9389 n=1 Tax=Albugo laibachii Nc14 TaxID=890382 RepID=F0W8D3_9STRA|nr:conserved hypothetical protein [Albugo laibachii Nc14]CCA24371.1 conserved hypothetical protein [Albugo laibachii Nc14]|eukprot:CCA24371.1 conserved hypothetical protein [Albugo laibachii Nc14]